MPNRIKERAKESLPREKIKAAGTAAVATGAELLAILLKTGAEGCDVLELSRRLIDAFGSIEALVKSDLNTLRSGIASYNESHPDRMLLGLGDVKILELSAAFELARRGYATRKPAAKRILTSQSAVRTFRSVMTDSEECEKFWVIPLDARRHPLAEPQVAAQGTVNGVDVHPRDVFKLAIRWNAHSIVVAHNHPSGSLTPGKSDIELTRSLFEAGQTIGIPLRDHLIIAPRGYYSFADKGMLQG